MTRPTFKRGILVTLLSITLLTGLWQALRPPAGGIHKAVRPYAFSIVRWEVSNAPVKWFHEATGRLRQSALSSTAEKELIREYLELSARLNRLESEGSSPRDRLLAAVSPPSLSTAKELTRRLERVSPQVESILQQQVRSALIAEGFGRRLPSGATLLLPPLSLKITPAPHLLAISPREKIELKPTFLMAPSLSEDQIDAIEREVEKLGLSASVERTGGIATYPSLIPPSGNLDSVLSTIAHEWFHHHLFFHPLGRRYRSTYEMTTINETVANIAGKEIGARARSLYYGPPGPPGEAARPAPAFDFPAAMRDIRRRVDSYLSEGNIAEAETFMEEQRLLLATKGYRLRKLNQAYLAFHSSYGDDPAFTNVIGQQLGQLRERSASLADFIQTVSRISAPGDLTKLLGSY